MRVLHLGNGNLYGGIERFLVGLALMQQRTPVLENHFLLSHEGRLSRELREAGVEPMVLEPTRISRPWTVLRARKHVTRAVETLRPDVVVSHGAWTHAVFGEGVPDSTPLVFYCHNPVTRDWLHRLAARRSPEYVLANSEFTRRSVSSLFPAVGSAVVTYVLTGSVAGRRRPELRAGLASPGDLVILQVSRLERWKGQALLLDAAEELTAMPGWRIWFVGGAQRAGERRVRSRAPRSDPGWSAFRAGQLPGRALGCRRRARHGRCLLPAEYRARALRAGVRRSDGGRATHRDDPRRGSCRILVGRLLDPGSAAASATGGCASPAAHQSRAQGFHGSRGRAVLRVPLRPAPCDGRAGRGAGARDLEDAEARMGIVLTIVSFLAAQKFARRGLGHALGFTLAVGCAYGILRAQLNDVGSYFTFDAALASVYLVAFRHFHGRKPPRQQALVGWVVALCALPVLLILISPFLDGQPLVIQLLGLRPAMFFVPVLLVGAYLSEREWLDLSQWAAWLALACAVVAGAELLLGVERFFPVNQASRRIYSARDVGSGSGLRIPSTFLSSHAYSGTMVGMIPILLRRLEPGSSSSRLLTWASLLAASFGALVSGARLPMLMLAAMFAFVIVRSARRPALFGGLIVLAVVVGLLVTRTEQFKRVETLRDQEMVADRVGSSVNVSLLEAMADAPLGYGLGMAFGTSIPYFLADVAKPQLGMESEYARIAVEEGVLGLVLWVTLHRVVAREAPVGRGPRPGCRRARNLGALRCLLGRWPDRRRGPRFHTWDNPLAVADGRARGARPRARCWWCCPCGREASGPPSPCAHGAPNCGLAQIVSATSETREQGKPWLIVNSAFNDRGGQELANLELARGLLAAGRSVTLVAHEVDSSLRSGTCKTVCVPRPLGSAFLGERRLELAARIERARMPPETVFVGNAGNCPDAAVSWVHFVHAAWPGDLGAAPICARATHRLRKADALRRERRAMSSARVIVANSRRTRSDLVNLLGVDRRRSHACISERMGGYVLAGYLMRREPGPFSSSALSAGTGGKVWTLLFALSPSWRDGRASSTG